MFNFVEKVLRLRGILDRLQELCTGKKKKTGRLCVYHFCHAGDPGSVSIWQTDQRSSPVPPGARVSEQFGDLGSLGMLANYSAWREGAGLRSMA